MKPITLQPLSVLAGLALAGVVALAAGAAQTPIPTRTVFVGEVPAESWVYVELISTQANPNPSYTVPAGRHFVVTSMNYQSFLYADGQNVSNRLAGVTSLVFSGGGQSGNGTRVPFGYPFTGRLA